MDIASLQKLEVQLSPRNNYIPEIRDLTIHCGSDKTYPVQNLLVGVASLARRCPNLKTLCLDEGGYDPDEYTSPTHKFLPFHSRLHSALLRQSFSSVTALIIHCVRFHSDTDFLTFTLSFVSLEELIIECVSWDIFHTMKEEEYIILLKKRQGVFGKLRGLHMVCDSASGRCSRVHLLRHFIRQRCGRRILVQY